MAELIAPNTHQEQGEELLVGAGVGLMWHPVWGTGNGTLVVARGWGMGTFNGRFLGKEPAQGELSF